MKHFFNVPNVHFVFGSHLGQLRSSVMLAYGPQIDAQAYLEKFIHLTFMLETKAAYPSERTTTKYIDYLVKSLHFESKDDNVLELCREFIGDVAEQRQLGLRTIERVFSSLALAVTFSDERQLRLAPIMAGLCVLKVKHPSLYLKAKQGMLTYAEAKDALHLGKKSDGEVRSREEWADNWWRYCTDRDAGQDLIQQYARDIGSYRFSSRFDVVPFTANNILDRFLPRRSA